MPITLNPRMDTLTCLHPGGRHQMAYRRWEPPAQPRAEVLCLHGFTRSGADFTRLAEDLVARGCAVTAPDFAGRGASEWLANPFHYNPLQYAHDVNRLLAAVLEIRRPQSLIADAWRRLHMAGSLLPTPAPPLAGLVHGLLSGLRERPPLIVIGTSLGGLVGMLLAARLGSAVDYLVLNDVGPEVPAEFIAELQALGRRPRRVYRSQREMLKDLRPYLAPLGPLSEAELHEYLAAVTARDADGVCLANDPRIFDSVMLLPQQAVSAWPLWTHVMCPTLVLRGEFSQVLPPATAERMAAKAELVEIPGVGHAPSLLPEAEREPILDWLTSVVPELCEAAPIDAPRAVRRAPRQHLGTDIHALLFRRNIRSPSDASQSVVTRIGRQAE
jgi:pimeloyl-ACP methyl ester carboxylesterase